MLVISAKSGVVGQQQGLVVAVQNEEHKLLIVLGAVQVLKASGQVKLGLDLVRGLQLSRRNPNAAEGSQTWEQIVAEKTDLGWTIVDDSDVAEAVFAKLLVSLPDVYREVAAA